MKRKGRGHNTQADIERRRSKVLAFYLRGLDSHEIAEALKREGPAVSRATVYRDIQALELWLKSEYQRDRQFLVNKALAELDQLWREAWLVFDRPAARNQDPSFRKLAAIDRLLRIQQMRNLVLDVVSKGSPEQSVMSTFAEEFASLVNSETDPEKKRVLLEIVERNARVAESQIARESGSVALA
jgi:hypothetical protein